MIANSAKLISFAVSIFIHILSSFAEKAPYKSFARNATSAPATGYYDYIVIGGGTAGCPLAATLSASAKVLLLERGGLPYDNPNVNNVAGFPNSLTDLSDTSAAQFFVSTDGVFNHRGRVLGGGSGINAGFYSRASNEEVRRVGWDPRLVNESYAWVEEKVAFRPRLTSWQAAVRDGLLAAGVTPDNGFSYDHLFGTKIGGSIFDENGTRHTSADLLEYADSTNILVYLYATVHQVLFRTSKGKRSNAFGVLFKDSKGNNHTAYLKNGPKNEIIISAGALGSPQILMLSGIGPARKLKALGIDVVLDQPLVGQGVSDNPTNGLVIPVRKAIAPSLVQVVGITHVGTYIETVDGPFDPSSIFSVTGQHYAANQNTSFKMLEVKEKPRNDHAVIIQKVKGPFSTGYIELDSKDPNENPSVTFNYFNDSRDLKRCVQGMKIMERVVKSQPISTYLYPNTSVQSLKKYMLSLPINLIDKHKSAASNLAQYCKDSVVTIWHYHGGCQVNRVVDIDYRVIGADSLRVVDGSTFYESPGTNPQATVMMLGRYVGQKILQQRKSGE